MRQLFAIFLLALAVCDGAAQAATSPPPEDILTVQQGQSLLVEYDGVTRVAVGDGELVDVKVFQEANEILIIALNPGVTDLRLWDGGSDPARFILEVHGHGSGGSIDPGQLQALLHDVPGIDVQQLGSSTVVQGRAQTAADYEFVQQTVSRYPNVISHLREPAFDRKPTVMLQARLLEVRSSALKDLGVQWSQFAQGPAFGLLKDVANNDFFRLTNAPDGSSLPFRVGGSQNFGGISTSLSSTLNLLMENGDARVLAEPTMTCVSGGTADFLAGGEVPIPVRDQFGTANVDFKEFGIILRFSPLVDADRFIQTDVEIEVSAVDPSITVLDIPGFLTRKTNTRMNVAEGETMVIAGLVSREDAKNVSKLPGLGQIPIIGELFKSRQFRNQQSELVVLVTPHIVEPAGSQNRNYRERFDTLSEEADEQLGYRVRD